MARNIAHAKIARRLDVGDHIDHILDRGKPACIEIEIAVPLAGTR